MRLAVAIVILAAACTLAPPGPAPSQPGAATLPPAAPQASAQVGSAARPIVMSFLPSQDVARVTASAKVIATGLEKATNLQWDVRVPTSYAATIEAMCGGQTDVAWLAPIAVVAALSKNCGEPLIGALRTDPLTGRPDVTYSGQIIVRADTGITTLKSLKGKRFAFGDRLSLAGTLYPMALVKKETGEDPKTFFSQSVFISGDDKAVLAVYQGQTDAGASFIDARDQLEKTFPDIKQKTKRIATAGPIPNDAVAARRGLPADLRDRIGKALVDWSKTTDGGKALKTLYPIDGLDRIDAKLYDPLIDAVKIAGLDLEREIAATAKPVATPTPTGTRRP